MRSKDTAIFLTAVLFIALTFSSGSAVAQTSEETQTTQSGQSGTVVAPSAPRRQSASASQPKRSSRIPRISRGSYSIDEGTPIEIRLTERLSSEENETGDRFEGVLDKDLFDGNTLVVPKGSRVVGKLVKVEASGRVSGKARMTLELLDVYVNEDAFQVMSSRVEFRAEGSAKDDATKVGVATGIGALIGAIAGGGKGAAIGAAIGGGASTTAVLVTKGKEIDLRKERLLSFRLERDLRVEIR